MISRGFDDGAQRGSAGTIFASRKLPLWSWFKPIYLATQSKKGISSIELGRRLGVTQTTAWTVKQKPNQGFSRARPGAVSASRPKTALMATQKFGCGAASLRQCPPLARNGKQNPLGAEGRPECRNNRFRPS
jgi:hypothetical protein